MQHRQSCLHIALFMNTPLPLPTTDATVITCCPPPPPFPMQQSLLVAPHPHPRVPFRCNSHHSLPCSYRVVRAVQPHVAPAIRSDSLARAIPGSLALNSPLVLCHQFLCFPLLAVQSFVCVCVGGGGGERGEGGGAGGGSFGKLVDTGWLQGAVR